MTLVVQLPGNSFLTWKYINVLFLEKEADLIAVEHRQEHGFNRPSWVEGHTALARLGCEAQARQ